ncbi:MAG: AAA domain-containing protein, partial [Dehalococcoidia bacterium]|nr:AAA domain-containing protein [Dehalococcoidia bacterium]
ENKRSTSLLVGVISGYSAQVEHLTTLIDPDNGSRWRNLRIEIATVDSFQGRECDVVVYSTVRSNRDRRIGFLKDYRRINVALSRARDRLVIVGDNVMMEYATIGGEENPFTSVLEYMRDHSDECKIIPSTLVRLL